MSLEVARADDVGRDEEEREAVDLGELAAHPVRLERRLGPGGLPDLDDADPAPGMHANVDQLAFGTAPVGAFAAGASPCGCHST